MEGESATLASVHALTKLQSEWTFAKQKWQRANNAVRGDSKYETAQILPGFSEKHYA